MRENYGKEALELAQEVSYKFRQEQTLEQTTTTFFKYSLDLSTSQTITLPTFLGQANTYAHIDIRYVAPDDSSGSVVVVLNGQKIHRYNLLGDISLDFILSYTNTLSFEIKSTQSVTVTDVSVTITGAIRKPSIQRDVMIIDDFGLNIYQPMANKKHYLYTFSSETDMLNFQPSTSKEEVVFGDYNYKYNEDTTKTGRVVVATSGLSLIDKSDNTTISSDVGTVDCACVSPLFGNTNKYIVHYVKENKMYYTYVGETFGESTEAPIHYRTGIKNLISLKRLDNNTHLPHFCYIDKQDNAYFVVCNGDGTYGYLQKLGKAEGLSVYQKGTQITIFLVYQDSVVKMSGNMSSQSNGTTFVVSGKSRITNVDSAVMSGNHVYYKSRNCVYEESNS